MKTYDHFGRESTSTDVLEQTTSRYTEAAGLTTQTKVTTPPARADDPASALTMTTQLDPAWGEPVAKFDPNGQLDGGRSTVRGHPHRGIHERPRGGHGNAASTVVRDPAVPTKPPPTPGTAPDG